MLVALNTMVRFEAAFAEFLNLDLVCGLSLTVRTGKQNDAHRILTRLLVGRHGIELGGGTGSRI